MDLTKISFDNSSSVGSPFLILLKRLNKINIPKPITIIKTNDDWNKSLLLIVSVVNKTKTPMIIIRVTAIPIINFFIFPSFKC